MRSRNSVLSSFIFLFYCFIVCTISSTTENSWNKKNVHKKIPNRISEKLEIPGCKSIKIWMIIKRETRAPSMREIFLIGKKLPKIRNLILKYNPTSSDVLHDYDLRAFRKWENKLTSNDYNRLPKENEKELIHVAERMHKRFPLILSKEYTNGVYKFKYADPKGKPHAFTLGLLGEEDGRRVWYDNTSRVDTEIEMRRLCDDWRETQPDRLGDKPKHEITSNFQLSRTVAEINERLKLPDDSINFEDIHLMHLCCLYETASNISSKSPWCSAFSNSNLKILKYLEDVEYFSEHEYSRIMNQRKACIAFDDLISFFKGEEESHKCTVYFINSGAILRVLMFFDRYNDEFPRKNLGITHINPFETNLAFVLYNCHGVLKVLILHEEHVIRLPCCPYSILCELSKISEYYSHLCDFGEICDEEKVNKSGIRPESLIMMNRSSVMDKGLFLWVIGVLVVILMKTFE